MQCLKCLFPLETSDVHYGLHESCFAKWFGLPSSGKFMGLIRRSSDSSGFKDSTRDSHFNTSFFHGKFKKYSAGLNDCAYILKMREADAPELPEVEFLCNQIGKLLTIPVAKFYLVSFDEEIVFVTKNFIKSAGPMDLQHIYHFRRNENHSCEVLLRVVAEKTKKLYDVKVLIKTILFDALIGNHDRHGRNLAFIVTAREIVLSPIYDNVSYLSLEKGNMLKADFNPTGKISTKTTNEPSMYDYVKELSRLGYNEEVSAFYASIQISKINNLIEKSFCSDLMKKAIQTLIKKRFEEIKDALSN